MGTGYGFKCEKCGNEYDAMRGSGMLYPMVYQETIEDIKNGKYGLEWQQLINLEEYVAVNAEREIYICKNCNHWKTDLNLSLYRAKDVETIRNKQYGIKTVEQLEFVPYVMVYKLEAEYDLIEAFVHKCEKCGKRMHKATDVEMKNLSCPKCGTQNWFNEFSRWD